MKRAFSLVLSILILSSFLLSGCGASSSEVILQTEEKEISGGMKALMKDGSEADSYSWETSENGGADFSFNTLKTISGGRVNIGGVVYYGPKQDLFDLDEEAYYTEEDWEKLETEEDYVPQVVLPGYEEIFLSDMPAENTKETTIAGISMKAASRISTSETENRTLYDYRACGTDGENLFWISISADALECTDSDAAMRQVDKLVQDWLASLKLGDVKD